VTEREARGKCKKKRLILGFQDHTERGMVGGTKRRKIKAKTDGD